MFNVGDIVLCYHTPADRGCGIDDRAFYDGERGTVRFVANSGILRYGVEFGENNTLRHNLTGPKTLVGLCKIGHGYWLGEDNLVLEEEECEEIDEAELAKILEAT